MPIITHYLFIASMDVDPDEESYGEYLDAIDRRGLGINVAALVPLTPLRHYVLGEASFERSATPEEIATMRSLLREALRAGAFGLSTTTSQNHIGYGARPLACRNASREELAGTQVYAQGTHTGAFPGGVLRSQM
jgi:N-acyl-D-aspartate/D-glutamate deacylase